MPVKLPPSIVDTRVEAPPGNSNEIAEWCDRFAVHGRNRIESSQAEAAFFCSLDLGAR
jgi:hypothetical protein